MVRVIGTIDYDLLSSLISGSSIDEVLDNIYEIVSKCQFDENSYLKINISGNDAGIASESTLSNINGILSKLQFDANDYIKINISGNDAGIASESTLSSINGILSKLQFDANNYLNVSSKSTKNVQQVASSLSVSANSSSDITVNVPPGCTGVAFIIRTTYNASATSGITVELYFSPDGTNYDTVPYSTYTPQFSAGATVQQTYIEQSVPPYLKLTVKNNDANYAATVDIWCVFI